MHIIIEGWYGITFQHALTLAALVLFMVVIVLIANAVIRRWKP